MQKNYIKEETIERMRLDEEVLMDFFREYLSVSVSSDPYVYTFSIYCNPVSFVYEIVISIYWSRLFLMLSHPNFLKLAAESRKQSQDTE